MVKAQNCKQCGRKIYFDGICISCQTENERKQILAMPQEELAGAIQQIFDEIEETGDLEKKWDFFKKLLNYRNINTAKLAEAAFQKGLFYPYKLYKDAPDGIIKEMVELEMIPMQALRAFLFRTNGQKTSIVESLLLFSLFVHVYYIFP